MTPEQILSGKNLTLLIIGTKFNSKWLLKKIGDCRKNTDQKSKMLLEKYVQHFKDNKELYEELIRLRGEFEQEAEDIITIQLEEKK